ncbi:Zn-dependent hydrolase [uncultured Comamonas sp.]|uniref:Zn-dependent hydrolase n=1 Tax=uncultured Comamonas sp. TaxID=114710 RepID=UPI0025E4B8D2|nr:Zn-dependent hydrolase [uncultured Comamonas sp.]
MQHVSTSSRPSPALLPIDGDRLWRRLEELAGFTRPDIPWTRRAFSPEHTAARTWLREAFEAAGLQVRLDAAGNLIGRRPGRCDDLKPLATGSHTDTVNAGGRFDGILGVLAGLEVAHALQEADITLKHPFEVIDFLCEEPSDYGISCVGSRAMVGQLGADMLAASDGQGDTLGQALQRLGARPEALAEADRRQQGFAAFVELHIEQGPMLEREGLAIGAVTDIVGIRRAQCFFDGRPDHAGTTPMHERSDALVAAAIVIRQAQRLALQWSRSTTHYVVATVGRLNVSPNASNTVPGRVDLMLEVRSNHAPLLQEFWDTLARRCGPAIERLRVLWRVEHRTHVDPVPCAPEITAAVERSARGLGLGCRRMPSGAGHDAMYLAQAGCSGMIFIPCLEGRSHSAAEWASPGQVLAGTQVLAATLLDLDGQMD